MISPKFSIIELGICLVFFRCLKSLTHVQSSVEYFGLLEKIDKQMLCKCFVNADSFKKAVVSTFAKPSILIFMVKPYINSSEPP